MNYRGITITNLIDMLNEMLSMHGDLEVFTIRGDRSYPVHRVEFYQKENHLEII